MLNRSAFELAAERAAGGASQPVALIILDIYNVRMVNIDHGHLAGDKVLEVVVERIRQALRTSDLLGRFAGYEFFYSASAPGRESGRRLPAAGSEVFLSSPYSTKGIRLALPSASAWPARKLKPCRRCPISSTAPMRHCAVKSSRATIKPSPC